jgi:predicted HicB family RNase H-like nuclease
MSTRNDAGTFRAVSPRKPDEAKTRTSIYLPKALHKRALHAAVDHDVPLNDLVVRGLEELLDRLEKSEKRK